MCAFRSFLNTYTIIYIYCYDEKLRSFKCISQHLTNFRLAFSLSYVLRANNNRSRQGKTWPIKYNYATYFKSIYIQSYVFVYMSYTITNNMNIQWWSIAGTALIQIWSLRIMFKEFPKENGFIEMASLYFSVETAGSYLNLVHCYLDRWGL